MSEWLRLDPSNVSSQAKQTHVDGGVEITFSMSPHDIPHAVRGFFDEKLRRFVIEFRYIQDESWKREHQDDYVDLRIGKNSGRLYGIEIDIAALRAPAINLKMRIPALVDTAIDHFWHRKARPSRQENYSLAKSVISMRQGQLFESLAGISD